MKRIEIVLISIIGLLLIGVFIMYRSWVGFLASSFHLASAFTFFILNSAKGTQWLKNKETGKFFTKSLLPFILAYCVSVFLFTLYWVSLSEDATFQFEYMLESYPHTEAILLPILYVIGIIYGFLRLNTKALKITGVSLMVIVISVAGIFMVSSNSQYDIEGVQYVNGEFGSIQELVDLPQFRDKTVYIDLWFSSCAPCIKQFKGHLPKAKERLASSEVVYLYLARETGHPDSVSRWKNAIAEYNLKGWHYYFPKANERIIWDQIRANSDVRIEGYPHYLVAKNGEIISYNAPKPSEIEELLEIITTSTSLNYSE